MSLPSWERGLKYLKKLPVVGSDHVAPLVGAWIEIETAAGGGTGNIMMVPYTTSTEPSEDLFPVYDTYEAFMESPVYVTRYENELLSRLEFIQYALAIMIALLFLLIFKKK